MKLAFTYLMLLGLLNSSVASAALPSNEFIQTRAALSYYDELSTAIARTNIGVEVSRTPGEILAEAEDLGLSRSLLLDAAMAHNRLSQEEQIEVALNKSKGTVLVLVCSIAAATAVLLLQTSCVLN